MDPVLPAKLPTDSRLDQIGFVGELQKHHADLLKTKVKLSMQEKEIDRATADYFEGLLVQGKTQTIDPTKFFKLCKKRLDEKQFLACITVNKAAAVKVLSGDDLAAISQFEDSSPALRVSRIKSVELPLVKALKGLGEMIQ